jgi:hypothetical protein
MKILEFKGKMSLKNKILIGVRYFFRNNYFGSDASLYV